MLTALLSHFLQFIIFCQAKMSTTTAVLLFILVGYSLQQDAITTAICDPYVQYNNDNCLSVNGFSYVDSSDVTEYSFCSYGTAFTQCIDASCMSYSVLSAAQIVVPALNRANICPNCYDEPKVVTDAKQTCTVWGTAHVVPFNRQPETCNLAANSTLVIFDNIHFTLTAESNTTGLNTPTPGITGIRFDYHYCAIFSRTWRRSDGWREENIATQGWFPHTIHITQNTTQVLIELPALNTEIIISAPSGSNLLAVSLSTGIRYATTTVPLAGVCMSNYCSSDDLLYSPVITGPCASYPIEFQKACTSDAFSVDQSISIVSNAVILDAYLKSQANSSSLGVVEFQKTGLPVVLTLGSTAVMAATFIGGFFWRRKEMKRKAETMEFAATAGCCNTGACCCCFNNTIGIDAARVHKNLESAPIRAIWCWIVFCLNPHVIGLVFPFTGMTILSAFCGVWILAWVGSNHQCIHFGTSKFTLQSTHIMKAFLGFALPQQVAIGIIGAAANEYYLIEVQFWWGIAVLGLLLLGGMFMCFLCLDMSFAAKILNGPPQQQQPMNILNNLVAAMEVEQQRSQQVQVQQQHVIQVQQGVLPPPMRVMAVEPIPQAQPVMVQPQQGPVVPPPQGHVIQPQQGPVVPPLQDHVIQPRPQSHVIEAQPIFYGNPSEAPPPPNGAGAFNGPLPVDVYQNPGKYMAAPDPNQFMMSSSVPNNSSDTSRQVAKRAIKIAGIEVDPVREGAISAKIQELLQTHNMVNALYGEDSRAAGLRNDLAKTLAEELKMYRNDSTEDLAYGLKEAILLWKDEHQL